MATRRKKTEGAILTSIQETVAGLHSAGVLDEATVREFDRYSGQEAVVKAAPPQARRNG